MGQPKLDERLSTLLYSEGRSKLPTATLVAANKTEIL